ncbi:MAG: hypothetical protein RLY70_1143 [Planctomycetota bacterium]
MMSPHPPRPVDSIPDNPSQQACRESETQSNHRSASSQTRWPTGGPASIVGAFKSIPSRSRPFAEPHLRRATPLRSRHDAEPLRCGAAKTQSRTVAEPHCCVAATTQSCTVAEPHRRGAAPSRSRTGSESLRRARWRQYGKVSSSRRSPSKSSIRHRYRRFPSNSLASEM